jgi:dTDP-4-dehydrorhamnose 3,5-epimerase
MIALFQRIPASLDSMQGEIMKFKPLDLPGAYLLEMELIRDSRGFFARSFAKEEMIEHGLESEFVQCNTAWNEKKNILRGLHSQRAPHQEVKLVRCIRGKILDVIVDIRPDSPTYCEWVGVELSEKDYRMLYVP